MNHAKRFGLMPAFAIAGMFASFALSNGCSAVSNAVGAAQGCDEFSNGSVASLAGSIDAKTFAFVQAAASLTTIAGTMETAVTGACIGIATDLGVADTWSAKPDADSKLTEACTQANTKIQAIFMEAQTAGVTLTLSVSGGECTVDASAQVMCEGSCQASASCMEPDITVRCQPGDLSVQCGGMCEANATCEGTATVAANCQGSCTADCEGSCGVTASAPKIDCNGTCMGNCTGTCMGSNVTGAACSGTCVGTCDATCMYSGGVKAHCQGTCNGQCTGSCTLAANAMVNCGAMVSCKGGCSGMATAPSCEGKLKPPMCMGDANCQASCSGNAELTAMCTPPTVQLEVIGTASTDITALVTTLGKNLGAIFLVAKTQGVLAADGATTIATTGSAVAQNVGALSGKALACATAAAQASVTAAASVNVSVMASVSVSASCSAGS